MCGSAAGGMARGVMCAESTASPSCAYSTVGHSRTWFCAQKTPQATALMWGPGSRWGCSQLAVLVVVKHSRVHASLFCRQSIVQVAGDPLRKGWCCFAHANHAPLSALPLHMCLATHMCLTDLCRAGRSLCSSTLTPRAAVGAESHSPPNTYSGRR